MYPSSLCGDLGSESAPPVSEISQSKNRSVEFHHDPESSTYAQPPEYIPSPKHWPIIRIGC